MGQASYSQVRQEFEQRVARGEFREITRTDGRAAPHIYDWRDDADGAGDRRPYAARQSVEL